MYLHVGTWVRGGLLTFLPLSRWLRMCSRMDTKLTNSGDESSIVSKQERSSRVFTENLNTKEDVRTGIKISHRACSLKGNFTSFTQSEWVKRRLEIWGKKDCLELSMHLSMKRRCWLHYGNWNFWSLTRTKNVWYLRCFDFYHFFLVSPQILWKWVSL